jgi:hypothetical protein
MKELLEQIQKLDWQELQIGNDITIQNSDKLLLKRDNGIADLYFLKRKVNEEDEVSYENAFSGLKKITFPVNFQIHEVLRKDLTLKHYTLLNDVFIFSTKNIESILITDEIDEYEARETQRTLAINPNSFLEIIQSYTTFYEQAKSYSNKFLNYKASEFQRNYFGIEKEKKTLSSKGEFSFVIDRFNLDTKRTKADFEKYLNENDLNALQDLNLKLIQKEVFGSDYLTKLNDYFIKIRLEDIIKLGREILNLKSPNLTTLGAKKVLKKITSDGKTIKQLESAWQNYFENYLSYLIFSYQKLYPKIELNVDLQKKYPDFIGINHFGGVDIIEIKTHLKHVVTKDPSHDNYAFSSELSKAIIQTINYMDALIQEKIKKKTQKENIKGEILEGNIYRPRGIIIISSYDTLAKGVKPTDAEFEKIQRDFTKLRNGLHNIQILTFDEILNMAENYKDNIIK